MKPAKNFEERVIIYLSHRPKLYALIVGGGIVLFWRGIWHTTDAVHQYFSYGLSNGQLYWWDGPLSLVVGSIILLYTGAFTSSFIGNELILSGLRGEKKLNQKTETEVKEEEQSILEIKTGLKNLSEKIEQLERKMREKGIFNK